MRCRVDWCGRWRQPTGGFTRCRGVAEAPEPVRSRGALCAEAWLLWAVGEPCAASKDAVEIRLGDENAPSTRARGKASGCEPTRSERAQAPPLFFLLIAPSPRAAARGAGEALQGGDSGRAAASPAEVGGIAGRKQGGCREEERRGGGCKPRRCGRTYVRGSFGRRATETIRAQREAEEQGGLKRHGASPGSAREARAGRT